VLNRSGISFSLPKLPKKTKLRRVDHSSNSAVNACLEGRVIASFPPRSLGQILKIIENGAAEAITIMEWLHVFKTSDDWRFNDKNDEVRACLLIWEEISKNSSVSQIAFFKSALAIDLNDNSFPLPLIDTANIAKPYLNDLDKQKVDWIQALRSSNYQQCAGFVYSSRFTVKQCIHWLGLPDATSYINQIFSLLVSSLDSEMSVADEEWLLECIVELPSTELVIQVCEQILSSGLHTFKSDSLNKWFRDHCLPHSNPSYFFKLNDKSKIKLKEFYKLSEFYKFKDLIELITRPANARSLKITDEEIKQLRGRSEFWSNYSERFIQVRCFVSHGTDSLLKFSTPSSTHYEVLNDAVHDESEVCIFELSNQIIVEIFRGALSEVRFFDKSERNIKRLLIDKDLSISDIRNMVQDGYHDHTVLWQYFCERLLRKEFNIIPNDGIEYLSGLSRVIGRYSHGMTAPLATPSNSLLLQRKEQLEIWHDAFWNREFKTEKYQNATKEDLSSKRQVNKILMLKSLGQKIDYESEFLTLANKGNKDAKFELAKKYLSKPMTAKKGQDYLIQSANMGHAEAIGLAKKYNIKVDVQIKPTVEIKTKNKFKTRDYDPKLIVKVIDELLEQNKPVIAGSLLFNSISDLLSVMTVKTAGETFNNPLKILSKLNNDDLCSLIGISMVKNDIINLKKVAAFLSNSREFVYINKIDEINKFLESSKNESSVATCTEDREFLLLSAGELMKKMKAFEVGGNYEGLKSILSELRVRKPSKAIRTIEASIINILDDVDVG